MTHNDSYNQFSSSDIAEMMGLESVTVRKYAIALENAGYVFVRSKNTPTGHRKYSEQDAMIFQQLKTLRDNSGLSVEKAAEVVVAKHFNRLKTSESIALSNNEDKTLEFYRFEERYSDLLEKINTLPTILDEISAIRRENEEIKQLLTDRDKILMQTLRQMQENATEAERNEHKKGFLWFFRSRKN